MDSQSVRSLALYSSAGLVVAYCVNKLLNSKTNLPYPPGPRPLPILGNSRQIPASSPWFTYHEWAQQYGPIVHLKAIGEHILVINSAKVADDLLEKRSNIYSDRPDIPMIQLMGWDFNIGFMKYGDKWRKYRRLMHHLAAAIMMASVYGYDIQPVNDSFVSLVRAAVERLGESVFPGAVAVNKFPWLRHFPGWLPGFGFQKFCADTRVINTRMKEVPYEFAKHNMLEGTDTTSVVARILISGKHDDNVELIQGVAGLAFAAGADTTVSAISTFFMAMALYPEVQAKAQRELTAVVGAHRLPEISDRQRLPYVDAVYREVLRWRPVLPLSVSHATSKDDVYDGYFIPKGTQVVANIWSMCHDESIYAEPDKFKPERFLDDDGGLVNDPRMNILAYGHGRRICVGRHMADETVWAVIASVLHVYEIGKVKDLSGNDIDIVVRFSGGIVSHPEPFPCSITPRSENEKQLVEGTIAAVYDI
ncbi:Cytochrome P450 [Mycena indigotica]|uniref:Cytochrome P450 n=1 Tax=Mycena indigotica TaxID=2126181 RepID=A0A8H6VYN5_9AGAR|nr:Cytochrome P450 [Mycena indigotica]KAF7299009.1 Cytochrome P450 [Mycena indigotica]